MVDENARLLPIVQLDGVEWLIDAERRQLRQFKHRRSVVHMHSPQGRRMVQAMQGTEWRCYGIDQGTEQAEG